MPINNCTVPNSDMHHNNNWQLFISLLVKIAPLWVLSKQNIVHLHVNSVTWTNCYLSILDGHSQAFQIKINEFIKVTDMKKVLMQKSRLFSQCFIFFYYELHTVLQYFHNKSVLLWTTVSFLLLLYLCGISKRQKGVGGPGGGREQKKELF